MDTELNFLMEDAMKAEKFSLDTPNLIYQMHDERIDEIYVKENNVILSFKEIIHPLFNEKQCKIMFSGFEDVNTDILVSVFNTDSDLNISGRKLYFDDFINSFVHKEQPIMDIIDILYGFCKIVIRGVLLRKSGYSERNILIQIEAKEMSFVWD